MATRRSLPGKAPVDKRRYSTRAGTRISPATLRTQEQLASRLIETRRRTAGFGWGRLLPRVPPGGRGPRVELGPEISVVCSARWPLPEKSIARRYTHVSHTRFLFFSFFFFSSPRWLLLCHALSQSRTYERPRKTFWENKRVSRENGML